VSRRLAAFPVVGDAELNLMLYVRCSGE
jgi:hypothetical protein